MRKKLYDFEILILKNGKHRKSEMYNLNILLRI